MAYTETVHQSWGSRLGNSFRGILFGIVLFVVAFPVLFKNEGRAVRRAKALDEGAGAVISVDASAALPENEGRLVHFSGPASTPSILRDALFGVETNAFALVRRVEAFQWEENEKTTDKKNLGGSVDRTTEYTYRKGWGDRPVDSSDFKEPEGHMNPQVWAVEPAESFATDVKVGAFLLPDGEADGLGRAVPAALPPVSAPLPADAPRGLFRVPQGLYYSAALAAAPAAPAPAPAPAPEAPAGTNAVAEAAATNAPAEPPAVAAAPAPSIPAEPSVGDLRVTLEVRPLGTVSVVARQAGSAFEPSVEAYRTSNGGSVFLIANGRRTAEEMFESARQANRFLTWLLRLVGFLLMLFGLRAVLDPLATLGDVVPLLGRIVGAGAGFVAGVLALALSAATIGVAWLFYRPLLGVPLLVAAVALVVWLARRRPAAAPAAQGG